MTEPQTEKTPKQRRKSALPALMRKLGQTAKLAEQAYQREDGNVARDDVRVRAIINTATGMGVEKILRSSPLMDERDNREFMRSKGWRV